MSDKRQKNQLVLAFTEEGRSEAPKAPSGRDRIAHGEMRNRTSSYHEQLMEEVCERENCWQAYKRVKANKGSPGIDGMKVGELSGYLKQHWPSIREQLLSGTYQPQPVRRVEIPKPDGGVRKLGIPTVLDRLIQQAVMQVLQRRWDPTFSEHSHGFRPKRSAHQAVAKAQQYITDRPSLGGGPRLGEVLRSGQSRQTDGGDRAAGDRQENAQADRGFLKVGVMENGLVSPAEEGTPQGGPLSPLLSNIVLDELDRELERRKHRFVRYADDCNIYVRSQRAGQRVMESITRFITRQLKLKVNEAKSAVARPADTEVPGVQLQRQTRNRSGASRRRPWCAASRRVRELTRRTRGISLEQMLKELSAYLRGWKSYFGFCRDTLGAAEAGSMDTASSAVHDLEAMETRQQRFRELRQRGMWRGPRRTNGRKSARPLAFGEQPRLVHRASPCLLRLAWASSAVRRLSVTLRTARCGPACRVVWQGRAGDRSPYAD